MKLTVSQSSLHKALSPAVRIASARSQLPVLSHVLIDAQASGLTLSCTNLEIGLKQTLGAKVEQPGKLTVPVKTLFELVSNLSDSTVELIGEQQKLQIVTPSVNAVINGTGGEEFPQLPQFDAKQALSFAASHWSEFINKTVYAAATEESRPVLTAVLVRLEKDRLNLVATDGIRLSLIKAELGQETEPASWLLPARTMQELEKLLADNEQILFSPHAEQNQVVFQVGNSELSSRLIAGQFPDYQKIIPGDFASQIEVDRQEFLSAVRLTSVFARESANIMVMELEDNKLVVKAQAPQVGDNQVEVDAKLTGNSNRIAFNYRYVLDFLQSIDCDTVWFGMNDPMSPGLFKPVVDKPEYDYLHIIMGVSLDEA